MSETPMWVALLAGMDQVNRTYIGIAPYCHRPGVFTKGTSMCMVSRSMKTGMPDQIHVLLLAMNEGMDCYSRLYNPS